jgi:hypothetical protein
MILPEPNQGELIHEYIKRLIDAQVIFSSQIPLAIEKFKSK